MTPKLLALLLCSATLFAHPMGNFSVSHYSKLNVSGHTIELKYALDLAEIPTFELLRSWNIERTASPQVLHEKATIQAREWLSHLTVKVNGQPQQLLFDSAKTTVADGAGNLPILRLDIDAHVRADGGRLEYEDDNYPTRAGWKEIVIDAGHGVSLLKASQSNRELSQALTHYPPDPTVAPPQDLRAKLEWRINPPVVAVPRAATTPAVSAIDQPHAAPLAPAPATLTPQAASPGSVLRGDFLSRLLHRKDLSLSMILLALAVAFGLGAAHALTPGHGKAIVAAYLVGARGTLKHAAFLGAMVTFTHTITVFALGLATLFLFRYIVPEKITVALGAISGLSIVVIGGWMLFKRIRKASHSHSHAHVEHHHHGHTHEHGHTHTHHHGPGGHTHSHVPDELSWGGLVALGASGGLVPCESALVLLLGAIALGRVGLGLLLLLSFSLGLAIVLMAVGAIVLYAKNLLPESKHKHASPLLRWISIASPAVVMLVGVVMTCVSLGWMNAKWLIG